MNTYYRDRNTGHPAAAYDLLRQNQWAFRSGCASRSAFGGRTVRRTRWIGWILGGQRPGGYGNYGGYNGGYGQPYGGTSMLAPLIQ